MNKQELETIAEDAIHAAFKYMQDQIGVSEGDFAGVFMCGKREESLKALFVQYMSEELSSQKD